MLFYFISIAKKINSSFTEDDFNEIQSSFFSRKTLRLALINIRGDELCLSQLRIKEK